jgi:hypothetical protein
MDAKQLYTFFGLGAYFPLTIHERINMRQNRNGLNINGLFSTCIHNYWLHSNRCVLDHPKINNGIYHHIGRTHSKYPFFK